MRNLRQNLDYWENKTPSLRKEAGEIGKNIGGAIDWAVDTLNPLTMFESGKNLATGTNTSYLSTNGTYSFIGDRVGDALYKVPGFKHVTDFATWGGKHLDNGVNWLTNKVGLTSPPENKFVESAPTQYDPNSVSGILQSTKGKLASIRVQESNAGTQAPASTPPVNNPKAPSPQPYRSVFVPKFNNPALNNPIHNIPSIFKPQGKFNNPALNNPSTINAAYTAAH